VTRKSHLLVAEHRRSILGFICSLFRLWSVIHCILDAHAASFYNASRSGGAEDPHCSHFAILRGRARSPKSGACSLVLDSKTADEFPNHGTREARARHCLAMSLRERIPPLYHYKFCRVRPCSKLQIIQPDELSNNEGARKSMQHSHVLDVIHPCHPWRDKR